MGRQVWAAAFDPLQQDIGTDGLPDDVAFTGPCEKVWIGQSIVFTRFLPTGCRRSK